MLILKFIQAVLEKRDKKEKVNCMTQTLNGKFRKLKIKSYLTYPKLRLFLRVQEKTLNRS